VPLLLDKVLTQSVRANNDASSKPRLPRSTPSEEGLPADDDEELRAQTELFRARFADGESLDSLLPEAFATVRRRPSGCSASGTSTSS